MEGDSVFLSYVRFTFKKWTGFQQAITEGMGGEFAKEKEAWLATEVENYFKRYDSVHPDEIEDYVGEMIENEFNTYFEDGSLQLVSKKLCEAYQLSLTNTEAEIFQEMKNSPIFNLSNDNSVKESLQSSTQEQSEEVASKKMENLTIAENDEDDGWTTVTKKGKNR
ncbi:pre-rRNA-processing protein TSR2 homolog [Caerostris darwini]|uniref:Pre-rRNA-processing protein TSR2 homolog n=1 Tax=Caerostris darwini TaxID=1538125 RepID=A0AAV4Q961_9ARAC|nr:pre-rRNA-processing protein TSR2 homolog [Caerostris darwini]